MRKNKTLIVAITLACAMMIVSGGCKSKSSKKRYRTLHGIIDTIDLKSKTVSMEWYNPKRGQTMFIAGRITKDTEIYIDGKLSDITKVKSGDSVVVEGYKKGSDIVAVKVDIVRTAKSKKIIKRKPTTQPSSKK